MATQGHTTKQPLCGAALMELKEGLREAELVRVAPGAAFEQRSSVVLLSGTLALTGSAADVPGMTSCNTLEQVQPSEANMCAARLRPLVVLGMLGLLCGGRLQQLKFCEQPHLSCIEDLHCNEAHDSIDRLAPYILKLSMAAELCIV